MHLVICDKRREFPSLAKEIQKKKQKLLNLVLPRMSTFIQAVGCWLLNHVIYLSLEENNCCQSRASLKNDNCFHSKWQLLTILSENNCHFVNLLRFGNGYFLLKLEINHVIQQLTANCLNKCRPPKSQVKASHHWFLIVFVPIHLIKKERQNAVMIIM